MALSKKFKTFIIIIACVIAVAGLGVGGYFLMSSMAKTVVYNFKIVNPQNIDAQTNQPKEMNDTTVYLVSGKKNSFPVQVVCETSTGRSTYTFSSSNPEVAQVVEDDDGYRVEYYAVGKAVITATSRAAKQVSDSFTITVSQTLVADINMSTAFDADGQEAADKIIDGKTISLYADGNEQTFKFDSTGALKDIACNNMNLYIVDNYDRDILQDVTIDQNNQTISITPKIKNTDSLQTIYVKAYYIDDEMEEHVVGNFTFYINVIGYRIADLQLLVSQDYNFVGTTYILLAEGTDNYGSLLENPDGEQIIDEINFTDEVYQIYFKVRAVYTNKTFADVSPDSQSMASSGAPSIDGISCISIDRDESGFWRVLVDSNIIKNNSQVSETTTLGFSMSHTDYVIDTDGNRLSDPVSRTFYINYLSRSDNAASNYQDFINNKLYAKDGDFYVYIYWDTRFKRRDVSVDKDGNIIGFLSNPPACEGALAN